MQHCDTLIAPGWCAPVEEPFEVLENHAVAVTDGRIEAVLPLAEAHQRFQASQTVERPGHLLIPGLVNTHAHAAMTLFRGFADDLPLDTWLKTRIWPAEARWVSPEFVRDGTALAIAEMLKGGTTCFADQYFFPEIVAETAVDLHMRATVGTPVLEFETAWASSAAEYLEKAADCVHDPYAEHPLISTAFAPHSAHALDDDGFSSLRVMADQLDRPIQIHLHETRREVADSVAATGERPLERLARLGLVNRSLLAVHAVHLSEQEVALLAESGVAVAHCPRSNLKLASGIAPIAAYRAAGLNVAIGTDSAASNNVLDMLAEIESAALLAKVSADDAGALTAREALTMGTLGGAKALGIGDETGSIRPGKWADLTCIDLRELHSQPVYDPIAQLVYAARADQVADVWVAGRHQVEAGRLLEIDTTDLMARAAEWRAQIAGIDTP